MGKTSNGCTNMRKPNGRFSESELQQFITVFECAIAFTKKNGVKRYQISLLKKPAQIIAEMIGDPNKGYKLRLMP